MVRALGAGGMGSVWVADHLTLKTQVAVKFILAGREHESDARERFSREAEAAAQVKSPHVAQIFDHGVTDEGYPFIVMELLEGEDLGRRLGRAGRVSLPEAAAIIGQVCRALGRAHQKGLVHRDVKPANIFLCDVGTPELFVKLLDFGVAKVIGADPASVTKSGSITGTPAYMAPEQLLGNRDVDHRADLFSVAVLAYELLTGRRPVVEDTAVAIALRLHTRGMPRASEGMDALPPDLAASVDEWFAKAWAIDPQARYDSALTLAEEFDALVRSLSRELGYPSQPPFLASLPLSGAGDAATLRENSQRITPSTLASGRSPAAAMSSGKISLPITEVAPPSSSAPALHTESPLSRTPSPGPQQRPPPAQRSTLPLLLVTAAALVVVVVLLLRRGPDAPLAPASTASSTGATSASPANPTVAASTGTGPATTPGPTATGPATTASTVIAASGTTSAAVSAAPKLDAKKGTGKAVPSAAGAASSAAPSAAPTKKLEDIE